MSKAVLTRAEVLGDLLRIARLRAGRTEAECGAILVKSAAEYEALEKGEDIPSLPELEALAMFLRVPMSHFWGNQRPTEQVELDYSDYLSLRQRIIANLLGHTRTEAQKDIESLAEETGISPETISAYESGDEPIPFFELELMAAKLDSSVKSFVDDEYGPLAEFEQDRQLEERIREWPAPLKAFVADSRNIAYLETAMRLSQMDADKLRSIAEGILEITL